MSAQGLGTVFAMIVPGKMIDIPLIQDKTQQFMTVFRSGKDFFQKRCCVPGEKIQIIKPSINSGV